MVVCGWGLQALMAYPGIWNSRYLNDFPKDGYATIGYPTPKLPEVSAPVWNHDILSVSGAIIPRSDRIRLCLEVSKDPFSLSIYAGPDAKGAVAQVTVSKAPMVSVTNDSGGRLLNDLGVTWKEKDDFIFNGHVFYSHSKGQLLWANLIEQSRISIQIGQQVRNIYIASAESQVRESLEHELSGGLRTWEAIFNERGYIPSGMGTGREMDYFSDTVAYAHLIHAAAQYLLYLDKKSDWSMHHISTLR
jgi:hypothetical protein